MWGNHEKSKVMYQSDMFHKSYMSKYGLISQTRAKHSITVSSKEVHEWRQTVDVNQFESFDNPLEEKQDYLFKDIADAELIEALNFEEFNYIVAKADFITFREDVKKMLTGPKIKDIVESNIANIVGITEEDDIGGTSSTIFSCKDCNYKTSVRQSLDSHVKAKHKKTRKESKNSYKSHKNTSTIPCDLCKYVASDLDDFKHHADEHKKDTSNECDQCDFVTSSKETLNKHIERKHYLSCKFCDYTCQVRNDLHNHIKKHHQNKECRYFQENRCNFKDNCRFKHSDKEA